MTNATLETLVQVIAQGRLEDRQDLAEMRHEMAELAKSSRDLNVTMTEYMTNQKHTDAEIEDLKKDIHGDRGLGPRVGALEVAQAEDKRNWLFTGSIVTILFTAFVGYYFTIVKPVQQSNVQSHEIKQLIESINGKL